MSSTAELRQILKEDANGHNLYDHLVQVLVRLINERPKNAYEQFELISAEIKTNPLNPDPEHGRQLPVSGDQVSFIYLLRLCDFISFIRWHNS
jgi:hypothetical protein